MENIKRLEKLLCHSLCNPGVAGSITGFSSLLDETINRGVVSKTKSQGVQVSGECSQDHRLSGLFGYVCLSVNLYGHRSNFGLMILYEDIFPLLLSCLSLI